MSTGETPDWQFYRHMPVFLVGGRRLGRTVEIGHAADWLHVRQGRWLMHDWYIPIGAVRDVTPDGVYLNVSLAALRARRWNLPPPDYMLRQGATPGYEYVTLGAGNGNQPVQVRQNDE